MELEDYTTLPKFEILPWQQNAWNSLIQAHSSGRLHHAYLISGLAGLGKLRLAYNLARSLLCFENIEKYSNSIPCGTCQGCHLLQVGNHPNLQLVFPDVESKSKEIKVEAVRELLNFNNISAHFGGYKVIIIAPAENMNRHAANSLLKILEEPAPATILILVSAQPERLLPTIRSRCQHLPLSIPTREQALTWLAGYSDDKNNALALQLARGAPLAALCFLRADVIRQRHEALEAFFKLATGRADPSEVAENWTRQDLSLLLDWLSSWIADLLRLQSGSENVCLDNPDISSMLVKYKAKLDTVRLHQLWSQIINASWQLRTNATAQLLIETILIKWSEIQL